MDDRARHITATIAHIQLMIGLSLYFISPVVDYFLHNFREAVHMREVLLSPVGKLLYSLRKATVEPVFGQIKEIRGLRRFRFRGLRRVQYEWKLICATHNLLKLFRYGNTLTPT